MGQYSTKIFCLVWLGNEISYIYNCARTSRTVCHVHDITMITETNPVSEVQQLFAEKLKGLPLQYYLKLVMYGYKLNMSPHIRMKTFPICEKSTIKYWGSFGWVSDKIKPNEKCFCYQYPSYHWQNFYPASIVL